MNGVVTVISIDNGKIVDNEPMTRTCKSCLLHEKLKVSDTKSFEDWKLTYVCKTNHIGTAGNMEDLSGRDLSGKTNYVTLSSMGMEIAKVFWQ